MFHFGETEYGLGDVEEFGGDFGGVDLEFEWLLVIVLVLLWFLDELTEGGGEDKGGVAAVCSQFDTDEFLRRGFNNEGIR